jgi:hypothetical protein
LDFKRLEKIFLDRGIFCVDDEISFEGLEIPDRKTNKTILRACVAPF